MSDLFSLVKSDYVKGGIMFVGSAILTTIIQMLQAGGFSIDWKSVLSVAVISALTYLLKQFSTETTVTGSEYLGGKIKVK
jgi:hypothetical protein